MALAFRGVFFRSPAFTLLNLLKKFSGFSLGADTDVRCLPLRLGIARLAGV